MGGSGSVLHGDAGGAGEIAGQTDGGRAVAEGQALHSTDEDLSLHPSEQQSLTEDPESVGTPDSAPRRAVPRRPAPLTKTY